MSRSKEGIKSDDNKTTGQQPGETAKTSSMNEQLGSRGQTDYTPGRESRRDFPRRTTSNRAKTESFSEPRANYESRYGSYSREGLRYEGRSEFESDYNPSERAQRGYRGGEDLYSRGSTERGGGRGAYERESRYGSAGRSRSYDPESFGSRYEGRGQQSRGASFDQRTGARYSAERSRVTDRDFDYDREGAGYRPEREDYYDPYNREALSGRFDYETDYEPRQSGYGGGSSREDRRYESESRRGDRYGRTYLRCGDIMTKDVTVCSPETTIREVADKMDDDNIGSLPVVENGRLIGIITDRDIVCRILAEGRDSRTATVREAMSEELVTCTPDDPVHEAIRKMGEHQVRRIPVIDINGKLRGIIAMADVALEAERDRELADALEQVSQPTPNKSRRL